MKFEKAKEAQRFHRDRKAGDDLPVLVPGDPEKIVASYVIAAVCQLSLLMKAVRVFKVNAVWLNPCACIKPYSLSSKRFYVSLTERW